MKYWLILQMKIMISDWQQLLNSVLVRFKRMFLNFGLEYFN